jgi:hypothetical protein
LAADVVVVVGKGVTPKCTFDKRNRVNVNKGIIAAGWLPEVLWRV